MAMIWAAYERVSTEEQASEGHSIQVQKEGIERYLKTKGDQLYRHYTDAGFSGASMERPALQALLEDARAGKFQGLVVHKTDRLSRKLRDILNIVESLKEIGIAFWTIDQGYDTSTPQGRLLFHQLASFADFERNMIVERTMQGLKKRAELGKYTSAQSPYGYDYDPQTGKLSINEKEAPVVRDLYRWIVHDRLSGRQACMRLIERGVPTKNAGRGKPNKRTIWRTSTIWNMLKNTVYYGQAYYRKVRAVPAKQPRKTNGTAPHKNNGRVPRAESERIPIQVPAIIDKTLYDQAQQRLKENRLYSRRNRRHDRPLRGLVSCGECGTSMEPVHFVSRTGKHYWKYRCRGRAYPELLKNCRIPHVKAEPFEEKVWGKFLDLLKEPGVLLGWAEADQKLRGSRTQANKELTALRTRKNFLATQEERSKAAFRLGGFTPEQFAEEMKRLREEREKVERELATVEASLGQVSQAESEALTETCRNLYNTPLGMNAGERQECLKLLGLARDGPGQRRGPVHGNTPALLRASEDITVKYFFHTFGCRVNQYETEALREKMLADGRAAETPGWEGADFCLINTCTVTQEADKDALRLIRRIARRNPAAKLVVTGCLASRSPETILDAAPAAHVVGNEGKEALPAMLGCSPVAFDGIASFHEHSRAFVKVQDGCNMHCTYCIIPSIRPKLSCKPWAELEQEVSRLVAGGIQEIVLCGVRLGRYLVRGEDGRRIDFVAMLERLLRLDGNFRIRLSSLEITDLTDRLIELLAASRGKLCPSFHLPLQAGSDAVLKRMERWYSAAFYERRVRALRAVRPDAGVFADVMVGFPGETNAQFEETLDLALRLPLSGLHVFRYSKRSGTPAARYRDQVPEAELVDRARRARALDFELRSQFAAASVGAQRRVLVEGSRREGLTEHFLRVKFDRDPGRGLVSARLLRADGPDVYAAEISAGHPKDPRDA